MTPSHGEDGSRTPGRSGAWDPTVSNTPAQPGSFDNYDFDETSPSPNYNPGTPGTPGIEIFLAFSAYDYTCFRL